MKIYFKHYCGAITEYDYLFFDCMAEVPLEDEDEALKGGWLPDDYFQPPKGNKSHWYQARQTRINLKKFKETRSTRKSRKKCSSIITKTLNCEEVDLLTLEKIFNKYFEYRGFKKWDLKPLIKLESDRKKFIIYYEQINGNSWHNAIAFSFIRDVGNNSIFSTQFAWDYENPKLYLGKYANLAEIDYCIEQGKDYMYLGFGYEKSCIYKADYEGFEFWTGEEWSNNAEHYKFLCERDSKIEKTSDLDKVKKYDDKHFFK
jgi:arginyl-tRNA--protein-N-Asp/Glu arginylyltransferase